MTQKRLQDLIILIKGGGEMASGVVQRLVRSGFRVCITEIPEPLAVRRGSPSAKPSSKGEKRSKAWSASGCPAGKRFCSPGKTGRCRYSSTRSAPSGKFCRLMYWWMRSWPRETPARLKATPPLVIGLGPGFRAGRDVHFVIETNRGHHLGRVIEEGEAQPDTGIPGDISGYTWERVLRAPVGGRFLGKKRIGDRIAKGEVVAEVGGVPLKATISGVLRGILHDGLAAEPNMKVGDVDPRAARESCLTVSDKARAIAGGVLEAILMKYNH